jgi:LPS-assembly protein
MDRLILTILVFLIFSCFQASYAERQADSDEMQFKGGVLIYSGNVKISDEGAHLYAERVEYNTITSQALATGNALLVKNKTNISSDRIEYNFKTGKGSAEYGLSASPPWYAWGEQINKVGENKYIIINGYVTTSPRLDPQWRLKSRKTTIYMGDKIVGKDTVLYFGKVPVFWLPGYVYSISDDGSPLNLVLGHSSDWGAFALVSYAWFFDHFKPRLHIDLRQENGIAGGVDLDIYGPADGKGKLETYYADDQNREIDGGDTIIDDERYRISFRHDQPLGESTYGNLEFHYLSDEDFLEDFFRDEFDLDVQKESFVNITHYNPNYTFNLFARRQINDFYNVFEKTPELSFDVRQQPLGGSPIYYSSSSSAGHLKQNFAEDSADTDYDSVRVDSLQQFSLPHKYFGWLNIIPSVGLQGTYYSDGSEESDLTRGIITSELEFFTKLFRVWDTQKPDLNIDGIRHVVEPRVIYTYIPTPSEEPEDLLQFDRIDRIDFANSFKLDLRNKIQTKRGRGVWDLIDFDSFIFYFPEDDEDGNTLSDFFFDLELRPSRHFHVDAEARVDSDDGRLNEFNTQATYYDLDYWSVNLEHRYRDNDNNLLAVGLFYQLTPEWSFRGYSRYEFEDNDMEEIQLSLIRDLETWETSITYRIREDEDQVWVMLYLKDYPRVPISAGN